MTFNTQHWNFKELQWFTLMYSACFLYNYNDWSKSTAPGTISLALEFKNNNSLSVWDKQGAIDNKLREPVTGVFVSFFFVHEPFEAHLRVKEFLSVLVGLCSFCTVVRLSTPCHIPISISILNFILISTQYDRCINHMFFTIWGPYQRGVHQFLIFVL